MHRRTPPGQTRLEPAPPSQAWWTTAIARLDRCRAEEERVRHRSPPSTSRPEPGPHRCGCSGHRAPWPVSGRGEEGATPIPARRNSAAARGQGAKCMGPTALMLLGRCLGEQPGGKHNAAHRRTRPGPARVGPGPLVYGSHRSTRMLPSSGGGVRGWGGV